MDGSMDGCLDGPTSWLVSCTASLMAPDDQPSMYWSHPSLVHHQSLFMFFVMSALFMQSSGALACLSLFQVLCSVRRMQVYGLCIYQFDRQKIAEHAYSGPSIRV